VVTEITSKAGVSEAEVASVTNNRVVRVVLEEETRADWEETRAVTAEVKEVKTNLAQEEVTLVVRAVPVETHSAGPTKEARVASVAVIHPGARVANPKVEAMVVSKVMALMEALEDMAVTLAATARSGVPVKAVKEGKAVKEAMTTTNLVEVASRTR